ncbi:MAG: hypothetical protein ABIH23_07470, partial [bacterium]
EAQVKASAQNGVVSVTYLPRQAKLAEQIPDVLKSIEGMRQLICTMARTNILWIQERFSPTLACFAQLIEVANKWDAAIELVRMIPLDVDHETGVEEPAVGAESTPPARVGTREYDGGIEDDTDTDTIEEDEGIQSTLEELIRVGRSGGSRTVRGTPRGLLNGINRSVNYSLVVIGDIFLAKGHSAQVRLARELGAFLSEQLKVPTVMSDELQTQFLFGKRQLVQLIAFLLCTVVLYLLVFTNQEPILRFLSSETSWIRVVRVIAVVAFVPLVAYIYGTTARLVLKLLKFE